MPKATDTELATITKSLRNAVDAGDLGAIAQGVADLERLDALIRAEIGMKRHVIRRRGLVRGKEVWCTWVLECEETVTKDEVYAILEETDDFPGDVYTDGDAQYDRLEIERARNWYEVIEGVPLIRMEKGSNGYDLRLVDTPETTATKWADMPETAESNRVEMPDANNQKTKLNVDSTESLRRILRRVVNGPDCLDALHEWESGYGHKVINGDTFEMHRHAAKAILEILERTSAE